MKRVLLFVCVALMALSCDKDDNHKQNSIAGLNGIAISVDAVEFSPDGESISFVVTANQPWRMKVTDDMKLPDGWKAESDNELPGGELTSGKAGSTTVTLTAPINLSDNTHNVNVKFKAIYGSEEATLNLTQPKAFLSLEAVGYEDTIDFEWYDCKENPESKPVMVKVKSNVGWQLVGLEVKDGESIDSETAEAVVPILPMDECLDAWLTRSLEGEKIGWLQTDSLLEGFGEVELQVIPEEWNSEKDRTIEVWAKWYKDDANSTDVLLSNTLTFNQPHLLFRVKPEPLEVEADAVLSEPYTKTFTVDAEHEWQVEEIDSANPVHDTSWIGCNPSIEVPTGSLEVSVKTTNPYREARSGSVKLKINHEYVEEKVHVGRQTINVEQDGYVFSFDRDNSTYEKSVEWANIDTTRVETLNIFSETGWFVNEGDNPGDKPDWIELSATSSEVGNKEVGDEITLSIPTQNLLFEDREASIRFETKCEDNDLQNGLKVTQDAFVFKVEPESETIHTRSTAPLTLSIKCSGPWYAYCESDGDWLELTHTDKLGTMVSIDRNAVIADEAGVYHPTYRATSENTGDKAREAKITVVSQLHQGSDIPDTEQTKKVQTFTIIQHGPIFEVSTEALEQFKAIDDEPRTFTVNCSSPWEIGNVPDWVTITPTSGNGYQVDTVTVTVNANYTSTEKTGSIVIKSPNYPKDDKERRVTVSQEAFKFNVTLAGNYDLDNVPPVPTGNDTELKYTFNVECSSLNFNAEKYLDSYGMISGVVVNDDKKSFTVTVQKNSGYQRSATITVSALSSDGTAITDVTSQNIRITQKGFEFSTNPSRLSFTDFSAVDNSTRTFTVTCSGKWRIHYPDDFWVKFSPDHGDGLQQETVKVSVKENTSKTSRSSYDAYVYSEDFEDKQLSIGVVQAAFEFDVDAEEKYTLEAIDPDEVNVYIDACSGKWEAYVNEDVDWITLSMNEGDGRGEFTIKSQDNTTMEERRATVVVVSKIAPDINQSIEVIQEAFEFDTEAWEYTFDANTGAVATQSVEVGGDGYWVVEGEDGGAIISWLNVGPRDGSGKKEIRIYPDRNTSREPRETKIFVVSEKNRNFKKTLTVRQNGAE